MAIGLTGPDFCYGYYTVTLSSTLSPQISVTCKVFAAEVRKSVIEENDQIPQVRSLQEEIIL